MHPVLFSIGGYDFLTSPLFSGLSALAAFFYFRNCRDYMRLGLEDFWGLVFGLAVSVFAGGVIAYFFLYGGGYAANMRLMAERRGIAGGTLYGSFWAATMAAYLFSRFRKADFRRVADALGAAAMLALVIKRWGCLMQGCCYGTPSGAAWAVAFTDPRCRVNKAWLGVPLHPTQLYESAGALAIFLWLHFRVLRRALEGGLAGGKRLAPGTAFTFSVAAYALLRFGLEYVRGSDPGVIRWAGLNTSQLAAALSLVAAGALRLRWRKQ